MNRTELDPKDEEDFMPKVLIIGGVLGAAVGLGAAYLFAQNSVRKGRMPEITAGDGVRLGLLLLGVLRSIAALGEGE